MTATVEEFLTQCGREDGYTESPPGSNRTKFASEAGHANGQPWCLTSLVAIANRVGLNLPYAGAYTPSAAAAFKKTGAWGNEPRRGAWVFYDWPGDNKNRIQHVGVVAEWDAHNLITYEGNTSADNHGSQDNGGGFYRRHRPRNSSVVGYGYPAYDDEPAPPQEDDMPRIYLSDDDTDDSQVYVDGGLVVVVVDGQSSTAFHQVPAQEVKVSTAEYAAIKKKAEA